ncbi:nitrate- and nitrite sensing domain-containing protein [Marinobacterium sp. D7]|uniref:nitrate- and nitrite sensing domain-containing protein n=1 Tax=Marinobacterium ramblicola TaxID=2849041 RepID=UPI001C2CC941|nr:nitrate- and nitrite sensing domain-containing protein [Marinobacterium ramblicola]MBV1790731.1 nitrate- and nitrite sensing domain-containing protein [Marinobacterium ramblicola]
MNALLNLPLGELTATGLAAAAVILFYALYRSMKRVKQRRIDDNLEQLKLLRLLLADLQRHRGLSTGLLSGDQSLRADVASVRARVDQSIARVQSLRTNYPQEWKNLVTQWNALRNDTGRDPESNMLDHHRLIRDTIFLIEDIAAEVDLSAGREELSYLICIWHEVVQTAEWSGQARALGTGIAAAQNSSAAQRVRLRFLHQKIEQLSQTAFTTLQQHFSSRERLAQCRSAVENFLQCINRELLSQEKPKIEAKHYFDQATNAINELLALVDTALNDLQQVHQNSR